jgi:hypothetical protein
MLSKLNRNALRPGHTAAKALPSGHDLEGTQPTEAPQPAERCAREEKTAQKESKFSRCFLRLGIFWLQNRASLLKAARSVLVEIPSVGNGVQTAQKLRLELEIRCSIWLSHGSNR